MKAVLPANQQEQVFDRKRVRKIRDRAADSLNDADFLFDWVHQQIADRLLDIKRNFPLTVMLGSRANPKKDRLLIQNGGIKHLIHFDLSEKMLYQKQKNGLLVQGDEEFIPFADQSLDMVIAPFNLHNVNDLPGTMVQINRTLKPDGLFLACLPGGDTLYELRQSLMAAEISLRGGASPRVIPFADKQQLGALLQRAGLALPVVDSEKITVSYEHPLKLMRDLQMMGESNFVARRDKAPMSRELTNTTADIYQRNFPEADGRITATFEMMFMIGWAPHESQQQPLAPGSAEYNLADALNSPI